LQPSMPPLLMIISGLSGAGKSKALQTFEDLGWYCTDNLPLNLLADFVRSVPGDNQRLAVGIDVRGRGDLSQLSIWRQALRQQGTATTLLFLEADDDVLLARYADTRRYHPLRHLGLSLPVAIAHERQLSEKLRQQSDAIIDTTTLNVHQLRRKLITEFAFNQGTELSLLFESFAYRKGLPPEADFVFDARVLPNPYWQVNLRPFTGRDMPVRKWLDQQPEVVSYTAQIQQLLDTWLPPLRSDTRSYVTVAFGCTGGKHRSVYLAERLATYIRQQGWEDVATFHREQE